MQSESEWSERFGALAALALLLTVCALPWIHGSNIPLARLVLQTGSAVAGTLSLLSWLSRRERTGFPPVMFPLAALTAIGVLQLLPFHAPLTTQMNHATDASLAADFNGSAPQPLTVRTGSVSDTRVVVAQLVALILLATTAYDQLRSRRAVLWSLSAFTLNAAVLSLLSFAQLFRRELFLIRDEWWTGMGGPFGPFVNPNNAAGWLVMGLASAVGLLLLQAEDMLAARRMRLDGRSGGVREVIDLGRRYLAGLRATQILAWLSVAVIGCAIVATRSRSGMIAVASAFVFTLLVRIRRRSLGSTLVAAAVGLGIVLGLLSVLNLQDQTMRELWTLRNPAGELSDRLVHWKDSLRVALDFPLFGAGLGAYRYITLPYQTRHSALWFQNADNQYLEVLVEAGCVGLVAFVLLGLPMLLGAVRMLRRALAGAFEPSVEAVATVLIFSVVAQAVFALTDYGAVLPATSALFVTLVSMLAAVQAESRPEVLQPAGQPMTVGIRLLLIVGALVFTSDLLRAQECYLVVAATDRVMDQPVSRETIAAQEELLQRGLRALQVRPDDARLHEAVSRLTRNSLRARFLKGLPGLQDPRTFADAWTHTSSMAIARRIGELSDKPAQQQYLQRMLRVRTEESGLTGHCQDALQYLPLPGPIVRRAARWALAARMTPQGQDFGLRTRFNEPANSRLGLQLGELALRSGDDAQAEQMWNQTLQRDESMRGPILAVYFSLDRTDDGLQLFGPRTYAEAVMALGGVVSLHQREYGPLRQRLQEISTGLWTDPTDQPPLDLQVHRHLQLKYENRVQEQIDWLRRCVVWSPDHLRLHRDLAVVLTRSGRQEEAMDAWYEVLRINPYDPMAEVQVDRLTHEMNTRRNRSDVE